MRFRALAVLALLALPALTLAQDQRYVQKRATCAHAWNLNGTTANDARNVALADLADSTTYTIAAQPDACRQVAATIVDANSSITAGILTVVYVDCLGYTVTWTNDFSVVANRGSAVRAIGYAASITSVTTNALTGEGGAADQVKAGDAGAPAIGWPMYGALYVGPSGGHGVDPFGSYNVDLQITTSGASSTTVTSVASNAAFTNVAASDILLITLGGTTYERHVTARASADSITVNQAITIPSAGVTFQARKFYFSTNPADVLAVNVTGEKNVTFLWDVAANADTGGVTTKIECSVRNPSWPTGAWVTQPQPITNITSGATTVNAAGEYSGISETIDLEKVGYQYCRMGFKFGTTDDGDGSPESIGLSVAVTIPVTASVPVPR